MTVLYIKYTNIQAKNRSPKSVTNVSDWPRFMSMMFNGSASSQIQAGTLPDRRQIKFTGWATVESESSPNLPTPYTLLFFWLQRQTGALFLLLCCTGASRELRRFHTGNVQTGKLIYRSRCECVAYYMSMVGNRESEGETGEGSSYCESKRW